MTTSMGLGGSTIPDITIPAGQALYDAYKDTLARPGQDQSPVNHELSVNGMRVRGRWILTCIRADYSISNQRTFWLTFSWWGDA